MRPLVSIMPERPQVETEPRRKLRDWEVAQLMQDQRGFCAACMSKLYVGGFDADHVIPLSCGGTNALTNFQLLCRPCHLAKTSGADVPDAAKIKRMSGEKGQRARRAKNGPKIKSRGFDKTIRKRMDGTVEKLSTPKT